MVHAQGMLRHCFFGEYSARIVLVFSSEAHAKDAQKTLGDAWRLAEKTSGVLVAQLSPAQLDAFKTAYPAKIAPCGRKHCKRQCKDAAIDSLAHSVDYGPDFSVEIPTTPAEQSALFQGAT